jgi:hypothetical protein
MMTTLTLVALLLGSGMQAAVAPAAPPTATLGTARLPHAVTADGKALAAGAYTVRLTAERPSIVVGQTPEETRWVEFVRSGAVAGREVATVVSPEEMKKIADRPKSGGAVSVQTLKGGDYLRVWVTQSGTHYLIHLPVNSK